MTFAVESREGVSVSEDMCIVCSPATRGVSAGRQEQFMTARECFSQGNLSVFRCCSLSGFQERCLGWVCRADAGEREPLAAGSTLLRYKCGSSCFVWAEESPNEKKQALRCTVLLQTFSCQNILMWSWQLIDWLGSLPRWANRWGMTGWIGVKGFFHLIACHRLRVKYC